MEFQKINIRKKQDWIFKILIAVVMTLTIVNNSRCQTSAPAKSAIKGGSYENTFSTSRIGLAQSVMIANKNEFHLVVQHRFSQISGNLYDFFGLDYAQTRLGFEYGIFNWLSAGIGRSMSLKTYDLELKALLLKQNDSNVPISLSYYVSVLDSTAQNAYPAENSSFGAQLSYVNQVIIARNQGIFSFQLSPMWLHGKYDQRNSGSSYDVFAIDIDGRAKLTENLGIIAEYIPVIKNDPYTPVNPFTIGLDIMVGGHQFQLIFSNSQGTNEKAILTESDGSWKKGHIYFGFNLTRIFNAKTD